MLSKKKYIGFFFLLLAISGCQNNRVFISQLPLITKDMGAGPWQIVTYDNKKISYEKVVFDGARILTKSESVYVSNTSQFVYRDGTPILTSDGKYIYWNQDGLVIDRHLQIVREDQIFAVDGRPMPIRTAMKLRDYHKGSQQITLAGNGINF